MGDVIYCEFREPLADVYKTIRDATVCNQEISNSEKVAVLELVKHELITNMHASLPADKDC